MQLLVCVYLVTWPCLCLCTFMCMCVCVREAESQQRMLLSSMRRSCRCRFLLSDTLFCWNGAPQPEVGEQSTSASASTPAHTHVHTFVSLHLLTHLCVFVCMCAFVIHSTLRCIEISFSLSFRSLQSAYRVLTLSLSLFLSLSHTH